MTVTGPKPRLSDWLRGKLDAHEAAAAAASLPPPADPLGALAADLFEAIGTPEAAAEARARASAERLAFIVAYTRDPQAPAFADRALVLGILNKEHAHQRGLATERAEALRALPPSGASMGLTEAEIEADPRFRELEARRAGLVRAHGEAMALQRRLFGLMKELTGKQGRTGGTRPLDRAAATGADDPLDAVFDTLLRFPEKGT